MSYNLHTNCENRGKFQIFIALDTIIINDKLAFKDSI